MVIQYTHSRTEFIDNMQTDRQESPLFITSCLCLWSVYLISHILQINLNVDVYGPKPWLVLAVSTSLIIVDKLAFSYITGCLLYLNHLQTRKLYGKIMLNIYIYCWWRVLSNWKCFIIRFVESSWILVLVILP